MKGFLRATRPEHDGQGAPHRDRTRKASVAQCPTGESPISVDINAFGVGDKKLQKAICDGVKLLRAKVMDMRAVALPRRAYQELGGGVSQFAEILRLAKQPGVINLGQRFHDFLGDTAARKKGRSMESSPTLLSM